MTDNETVLCSFIIFSTQYFNKKKNRKKKEQTANCDPNYLFVINSTQKRWQLML